MGTRIVGASRSLIERAWQWPVHGLRHPVVGDTTGWYVWTGELSSASDFFLPWHEDHLVAAVPEIAELLALPPGSRFLLAPDSRDVWDPSLLEVQL
jgi:hypothetical protein